MKINNLLFIGFVVGLFFIASCTNYNQKTTTSTQNMGMDSNQTMEDLQFKKMCQDSGYEWNEDEANKR